MTGEMTLQPAETTCSAVWMQEAMHRTANLQHLAINIDRLLDRGKINSDERPRMVRRAAALLRAYASLDQGCEPSPCTPDLGNIACGLIEMFGHSIGSMVLILQMQPLELEGDRRRALLLATSELVINALRHAFSGRRTGTIQVHLRCDREQGEASLCVADDGIGPDRIGSGAGSGCRIIRGLTGVLDGDIVWGRSLSLGGTEAVLSFPL